jgi:protein-S-isoprenylcysteine O-methyltransferase Ste14
MPARKFFALLGSAIFLVIAPGFVAGLAPYWVSGWRRESPPFHLASLAAPNAARFLHLIHAAGVVLFLLAFVLLLDSFLRFALQGLGTPAPIFPTERLIITGLYRYVRNPIYLAVVSLILGQALYLTSLSLIEYAAFIALCFHTWVLIYEEPTLRRTFGAEFELYCSSVPRWLPRLTPWQPDSSKTA